MCVEVRHARESLTAARPLADDGLAVGDSRAGMVHVDVPLKLGLAVAAHVAEGAVDVLPTHVRLELGEGAEADPPGTFLAVRIVRVDVLGGALLAPELDFAVLAVHVAAQGTGSVKAGLTAIHAAREGGKTQVSDSDVALECLVLAETEIAAVVAAAAETFGALVDGSMAAETGRCDEGLTASGFRANVFPFVSVRALDVLCEVLLLEIGLVAALVGTLVRAIVGV